MNPIRLEEKLLPENIFLDVEASGRFELIRLVTRRMQGHAHVRDSDRLAEDAIRRENELSTGIDRGIAMPHARTDAVDALICAFIRPKTPIDFGSADGNGCDLVFFSAVPRQAVDQYLHLTAALVRRLLLDDVTMKLRAASSPAEVFEALGIESA